MWKGLWSLEGTAYPRQKHSVAGSAEVIVVPHLDVLQSGRVDTGSPGLLVSLPLSSVTSQGLSFRCHQLCLPPLPPQELSPAPPHPYPVSLLVLSGTAPKASAITPNLSFLSSPPSHALQTTPMLLPFPSPSHLLLQPGAPYLFLKLITSFCSASRKAALSAGSFASSQGALAAVAFHRWPFCPIQAIVFPLGYSFLHLLASLITVLSMTVLAETPHSPVLPSCQSLPWVSQTFSWL